MYVCVSLFVSLCVYDFVFFKYAILINIRPCKTVILAGESRSSICVDVDAKPRSGCSSGNIIINMIGHDNCYDDDQ